MRRKHPVPPLFALMLIMAAATGLSACQREEPAPGSGVTSSSIEVVSIEPSTDTLLRVGDTVRFRAQVEYQLGPRAGSIGFVVQDAAGTTLLQQVGRFDSGVGRLELEAELVVPPTTALHVIIPLSERGRSVTRVVDIKSFGVEAQ